MRDDERDPEPQRRLRRLLEKAQRWQELVQTLDLLAENELDFDQRDEAAIAAANVAHARLGDGEAAFGRLLPLVEQRNETAERALREIALAAGMQQQLSALYVKLARETEDPAAQAQYWSSAAKLFETELGEPAQALEASLRMLATDLGNREYLAQVDRLGRATGAFKRLSQVYDRLLKQAEDDSDKVALLRRHADLLDESQPDDALDRILRACALSPHDEELLARAETLAHRTKRSEELLRRLRSAARAQRRRARQGAAAAARGATVRRCAARPPAGEPVPEAGADGRGRIGRARARGGRARGGARRRAPRARRGRRAPCADPRASRGRRARRTRRRRAAAATGCGAARGRAR